MSGRRGLWQALAGAAIGAILGAVIAFIIIDMAKTEEVRELYVSDMTSINMLYQARNMEEYLKLMDDELVREFVETGGPRGCGTVDLNGTAISIWKELECEVTDPVMLANYSVLMRSGEIAAEETAWYKSFWGVETYAREGEYCLRFADEIEFGEYYSKVCFKSPLNAEMELAFQDMVDAYNSGDATCECFDTYSICQAGIDDYMFTYALAENC